MFLHTSLLLNHFISWPHPIKKSLEPQDSIWLAECWVFSASFVVHSALTGNHVSQIKRSVKTVFVRVYTHTHVIICTCVCTCACTYVHIHYRWIQYINLGHCGLIEATSLSDMSFIRKKYIGTVNSVFIHLWVKIHFNVQRYIWMCKTHFYGYVCI